MNKEFPIAPTEQHYEELVDGKTVEQKESERMALATQDRFKNLMIKAWTAGYHITGRPVDLDKAFQAPELAKKENIPTLKFKDRKSV
jgi:hypothetical protein